MYEHGGNPPNGLGERHSTSSSGIADMRIGVGYWLFKPFTKSFNFALGAGVKLPTGDFSYMDTFYNVQNKVHKDSIHTFLTNTFNLVAMPL